MWLLNSCWLYQSSSFIGWLPFVQLFIFSWVWQLSPFAPLQPYLSLLSQKFIILLPVRLGISRKMEDEDKISPTLRWHSLLDYNNSIEDVIGGKMNIEEGWEKRNRQNYTRESPSRFEDVSQHNSLKLQPSSRPHSSFWPLLFTSNILRLMSWALTLL